MHRLNFYAIIGVCGCWCGVGAVSIQSMGTDPTDAPQIESSNPTILVAVVAYRRQVLACTIPQYEYAVCTDTSADQCRTQSMTYGQFEIVEKRHIRCKRNPLRPGSMNSQRHRSDRSVCYSRMTSVDIFWHEKARRNCTLGDRGYGVEEDPEQSEVLMLVQPNMYARPVPTGSLDRIIDID